MQLPEPYQQQAQAGQPTPASQPPPPMTKRRSSSTQ